MDGRPYHWDPLCDRLLSEKTIVVVFYWKFLLMDHGGELGGLDALGACT